MPECCRKPCERMYPRNLKAVIVDLDNTLLRTDKTISAYTAQILKKCKENAVSIMAATARPLRTMQQYCRVVGFDAMAVSNGARVFLGDRQRTHGICLESAVELLTFLQQYPDLRVTLETGECAYSNQPVVDYETVICQDLAGIARAEGVLKLLVHIDRAETLPMVAGALTEDLYYTISNGYLMQIMSKAATKWNGVKAMLEIAGCTPEEAIYFGDDHDDIEPIRMCAVGIAMSNAIDAVKAAADAVTESNDGDGVAKYLEQWLRSRR